MIGVPLTIEEYEGEKKHKKGGELWFLSLLLKLNSLFRT